jgi:sodium/potassium-transporting ATPase subunit alpha
LSATEARERLLRNGPNSLTPQAETSMIVKFAQNLFGGFAILLWIGAILSSIGYGIQFTTSDNPPIDNVSTRNRKLLKDAH